MYWTLTEVLSLLFNFIAVGFHAKLQSCKVCELIYLRVSCLSLRVWIPVAEPQVGHFSPTATDHELFDSVCCSDNRGSYPEHRITSECSKNDDEDCTRRDHAVIILRANVLQFIA